MKAADNHPPGEPPQEVLRGTLNACRLHQVMEDIPISSCVRVQYQPRHSMTKRTNLSIELILASSISPIKYINNIITLSF